MALVLRAGLADPRFLQYFSSTTFSFGPVGGPSRPLESQNELWHLGFSGEIGAKKNGWTTPAGHTFAAAAQRGGRTLIVTMLNDDPPGRRGRRRPAELGLWTVRLRWRGGQPRPGTGRCGAGAAGPGRRQRSQGQHHPTTRQRPNNAWPANENSAAGLECQRAERILARRGRPCRHRTAARPPPPQKKRRRNSRPTRER